MRLKERIRGEVSDDLLRSIYGLAFTGRTFARGNVVHRHLGTKVAEKDTNISMNMLRPL